MPTKRVLLLLCDGTELFEAAAFYDVLGWSGAYGAAPVEVVTVAPRREIVCTFGLTLRADRLLSAVEPRDFDAIAVPGGFESFGYQAAAAAPDVQAFLAAFAALGRPVATICVGALPLARTGALTGRTATTYHLMGGARRRQLAEFGASVVDRALVQDGPFITSTSPATAVDVALRLLAALTGDDNARHVRTLMGFAPGDERTTEAGRA